MILARILFLTAAAMAAPLPSKIFMEIADRGEDDSGLSNIGENNYVSQLISSLKNFMNYFSEHLPKGDLKNIRCELVTEKDKDTFIFQDVEGKIFPNINPQYMNKNLKQFSGRKYVEINLVDKESGRGLGTVNIFPKYELHNESGKYNDTNKNQKLDTNFLISSTLDMILSEENSTNASTFEDTITVKTAFPLDDYHEYLSTGDIPSNNDTSSQTSSAYEPVWTDNYNEGDTSTKLPSEIPPFLTESEVSLHTDGPKNDQITSERVSQFEPGYFDSNINAFEFSNFTSEKPYTLNPLPINVTEVVNNETSSMSRSKETSENSLASLMTFEQNNEIIQSVTNFYTNDHSETTSLFSDKASEATTLKVMKETSEESHATSHGSDINNYKSSSLSFINYTNEINLPTLLSTIKRTNGYIQTTMAINWEGQSITKDSGERIGSTSLNNLSGNEEYKHTTSTGFNYSTETAPLSTNEVNSVDSNTTSMISNNININNMRLRTNGDLVTTLMSSSQNYDLESLTTNDGRYSHEIIKNENTKDSNDYLNPTTDIDEIIISYETPDEDTATEYSDLLTVLVPRDSTVTDISNFQKTTADQIKNTYDERSEKAIRNMSNSILIENITSNGFPVPVNITYGNNVTYLSIDTSDNYAVTNRFPLITNITDSGNIDGKFNSESSVNTGIISSISLPHFIVNSQPNDEIINTTPIYSDSKTDKSFSNQKDKNKSEIKWTTDFDIDKDKHFSSSSQNRTLSAEKTGDINYSSATTNYFTTPNYYDIIGTTEVNYSQPNENVDSTSSSTFDESNNVTEIFNDVFSSEIKVTVNKFKEITSSFFDSESNNFLTTDNYVVTKFFQNSNSSNIELNGSSKSLNENVYDDTSTQEGNILITHNPLDETSLNILENLLTEVTTSNKPEDLFSVNEDNFPIKITQPPELQAFEMDQNKNTNIYNTTISNYNQIKESGTSVPNFSDFLLPENTDITSHLPETNEKLQISSTSPYESSVENIRENATNSESEDSVIVSSPASMNTYQEFPMSIQENKDELEKVPKEGKLETNLLDVFTSSVKSTVDYNRKGKVLQTDTPESSTVVNNLTYDEKTKLKGGISSFIYPSSKSSTSINTSGSSTFTPHAQGEISYFTLTERTIMDIMDTSFEQKVTENDYGQINVTHKIDNKNQFQISTPDEELTRSSVSPDISLINSKVNSSLSLTSHYLYTTIPYNHSEITNADFKTESPSKYLVVQSNSSDEIHYDEFGFNNFTFTLPTTEHKTVYVPLRLHTIKPLSQIH